MSAHARGLHPTGTFDAARSDVYASKARSEPRSKPVPSQSEATPPARPPTLRSVLAALPLLGVRRLTRIALELATELDLALRCEVTPDHLHLDRIFVEQAGTPFERTRLPVASRQTDARAPRASLRELGLLLAHVLADKPLYLEESLWMPRNAGARVLRRRADAEIVHSLGRALSLIAQRCAGGPRAYQQTSALVDDLTKLAELTNRIVAHRRAIPPVVSVHRPKLSTPRAAALPKVLLQGNSGHPLPETQPPRDAGG